MRKTGGLLLLLGAMAHGGCAVSNSPAADYTIAGVGGGAVGAGTGALIGAAISNGDVGASALLGGAIGIPAGILLNYLILRDAKAQKESERDTLRRAVQRNQERIEERERLLDDEWERLRNSSPRVRTDELPADVYMGPTMGDPKRN